MKFSVSNVVILTAGAASVMGKLDYSARSTAIDLSGWVIDRFNDLGAVRTNAQLGPVMDAFFSQNITIIANGESINRSTFVEEISTSLPGLTGSKFTPIATLPVPADPEHPEEAGWVAVFSTYLSIYSSGNNTLETDSDHFLIEQDPTIHSGDARRVTYLHHIDTIVNTTEH